MTITSEFIKAEALKLGFFDCGISKTEFIEKDSLFFNIWLEKNYHADMNYMKNHYNKRMNPSLLVENAKSIISVLLNYYPEKRQNQTAKLKISKYAYGVDYHIVLKNKLRELLTSIQIIDKSVTGRFFTDSAPILERAWAKYAGLGWIGKNSNLITKKGSYFFIGELIIDKELEYDKPELKNYCGNCTRCIDSCPTKAIVAPYTIDSNKCISYQTIENKNESSVFDSKGWIFGCDMCQDVCPFNKKAVPTSEKNFQPIPQIINSTDDDWIHLQENEFNILFNQSPIKRTKFQKLKKNIINAIIK